MSLEDSISVAMRKDTPSVNLDDSLRKAIQVMADGDVTAIMVKSGEELVGLVTESDIMDQIAREADPDEVKVSQLMTACELISAKPVKVPCIQLDEEETIRNALAIMHEAGIRNLLVAGEKGQARGIISAGDLLKHAI